MRQVSIVALTVVAFAVSNDAFGQTNNHFARQQAEAAARRASAASGSRATTYRHWGGPTTNHRWYPNTGIRNNSFGNNGVTVTRQNVQFVPVSPFGFGYPAYGYPRYSNPYGFGWNPRFGYPRYGVPFNQHIHIQHEIIRE